jgi:predicted ABC-type ATPase
MTASKQLWLLTGGNGSGKSTFYRLFLETKGIHSVNADMIAKKINPENPEKVSYEAASLAIRLLEELLYQGTSFCYETVFSHPSKIDLVAKAKALGYEIILVYIHLDTPALNEARVRQRVSVGGHNVPTDKIHSRIPRTMKNVATLLSLVNEARLLDNSSLKSYFQQVAIVRQGIREMVINPLPKWAEAILTDIP